MLTSQCTEVPNRKGTLSDDWFFMKIAKRSLQLLRSPTFHRGVGYIHKRVHQVYTTYCQYPGSTNSISFALERRYQKEVAQASKVSRDVEDLLLQCRH